MSGEIALLGRILQLAGQDDVDLEEFRSTVAGSPHLAAKVVKLANSPLYGMAGRITRLERAVLILGVRAVGQIASSVLIQNQLSGLQIPGAGRNALWLHSLETGACCELMARCLGWPQTSEAYLSGLLHDLGVLELYREHGAAYAQLLAGVREGEDLAALEQATFKEDHASRLHVISETWGFPAALREVIGAHHDPSLVPEAHRPLARLVRAAHALVQSPLGGWSDLQSPADAPSPELTELGLTDADVEDVRSLLRVQLRALCSAYAG